MSRIQHGCHTVRARQHSSTVNHISLGLDEPIVDLRGYVWVRCLFWKVRAHLVRIQVSEISWGSIRYLKAEPVTSNIASCDLTLIWNHRVARHTHTHRERHGSYIRFGDKCRVGLQTVDCEDGTSVQG